MSARRARSAVLVAALIALAVASSSLPTADRELPIPEVLGEAIASGLTGEGSCDVDGVAASYQTSFLTSPAPAGHRVTGARIDGINQPSCGGSQLRVVLREGTEVRATATAIVATQSTATVVFASPPLAEVVDGVHVELAGGEVPIPEPCKQMRLDVVRVGTTGPDVMGGTNQRDLVFGLDGDDMLEGTNQNDCLDGGAGLDRLVGGTQDDTLLGGDGDDTLFGGEGKDDLRGGEGNDVIHGEQGNDRIDGGGGTDTCSGGPGNNQISCEVIVP